MSVLTVLTATVYPDVVRIWYACVERAFSRDEVAVEIFHDSPGPPLLPELFPGATLLAPGPSRRNFQEAYNDAVARVDTPYLALVDCDIFWIDATLWPRVYRELERRPQLAAYACVSRFKRRSHGTYAVVLKTAVYRQIVAELPGGFCEAITHLDPALPPEQWQRHDTGDLVSQAVLDRGYELELLHLEDAGQLVRFENTTVFRLAVEHAGIETLARALGENRFFWRGYLSNCVLKQLSARLFPQGPVYDFPYDDVLLRSKLEARMPSQRVATYRARLEAGARRIEAFVVPGRSPGRGGA